MSSTGAFFLRLHDALVEGPVVLMTVVHARGSTPRVAGARQFLSARGDSFGTIGGGVTEFRAMELARETLADGQARSFHADLGGTLHDQRDGICGGTMRVSIVRLEPARMLDTVRNISDQLNSGQRVHLATHCEGDQALIIHPVSHSAHSTDEVFTQLIDPTPALLIIGAGHIGRALARLACDLEFTVFVHDDRAEWLTDSAFPNCRALELTLNAALAPLQQWEGMRFAALVTRGFAQDVAALQQLRTIPNWRYIGLLGSKRRITKVLADQDPWPHEVLHAPTGIEIAAETPMEIAISIAAEMIQVMRDAKGRTSISAME